MNAYADTKDYFNKYFEMVLFLPFFFYQLIILDLNSPPLSALLVSPDFATRHQKHTWAQAQSMANVWAFGHHSFTVGFACMSWFCHLAPETISEQNINPPLFPCFCVRRRLWALSTLLILHRWLYLHPDFAKWRQETCSADAVRMSDFIS